MKSDIKKVIFLLIITILYFFCLFLELKTKMSYIFILLCLCFIVSNIRKEIVCANNLFIAYFLYTVGIGPIFLISNGIEYKYDFFQVILGSLLSFVWGSLLVFSNKSKKIKKTRIKQSIVKISKEDIIFLIYLFSISVSIYFLFSNRAYLFGSNVNSYRMKAYSGNGKITFISQIQIMLVPMMYDLYIRNKDKIKIKYKAVVMFIISSILLLFFGFRTPLMTMYIWVALLYMKDKNTKMIEIMKIIGVLIIIVSILGYIRNVKSNGVQLNTSFLDNLKTTFVVNLYNLDYIFNKFPLKVPFQKGYTYLINFIMLRPGPDLDFTLWLKEKLGLSFSGGGVTPTVMGEFYINYGKVGIYTGMFLLGKIGNKLKTFCRKRENFYIGIFYSWEFAHCVSGGIANVILKVILYTIIYKIILFFSFKEVNRS